MTHYPQFAWLLNKELYRQDRSASWLARGLGVRPGTVTRWLNHGTRPGTPEMVVKITDLLGITSSRHAFLAAAGYGYLEVTGHSDDLPAGPVVAEPAPDAQGRLPPLPHPATPLVGRQEEVTQLNAWMTDAARRLVIIVGPGGIGKTRLALAVAQEQLHRSRFRDGIAFVDLAPLSADEQVTIAFAQALTLTLSAGRRSPAQQLFAYLRDREMLVILDNVEHLSDETRRIVQIIRDAANIRILATSRTPLGLPYEQLYFLDGLDYSDNTQDDAAPYAPATALFLQAARRVRPDYDPGPDEVEGILELCRLVEGTPLAIELAASWVAVMRAAAIVSALRRSPAFLESDLRGMPERHRSMKVVFGATWQHLDDPLREIFAQLSIFRGGFTRDAGIYITGTDLRQLRTLALQSLTTYQAERDRYTIHELLRQFAYERLARDEKTLTATQTRHSQYYLALVVEQHERFVEFGEQQAFAAITNDFDNLASAWCWAVQHKDFWVLDPALDALHVYCDLHGRFLDGISLLRSLANELSTAIFESETEPQRFMLGRVLTRLGRLQWRVNDESVYDTLNRALVYAGEIRERAIALCYLGHAEIELGYITSAIDHLRESCRLCREIDDQIILFEALDALAQTLWSTKFEEARHTARKMLAIGRNLGRSDLIAGALNTLGYIECLLGQYKRAVDRQQESIGICEKNGYLNLLASGLNFLSIALWHEGIEDYRVIVSHCDRSIALFEELGKEPECGWVLGLKAIVLRDAGDVQQALSLAEQAADLACQVGANSQAVPILGQLGSILTTVGDYEGAWSVLRDALTMSFTSGHYNNAFWILFYISELMVAEQIANGRQIASGQLHDAHNLLTCVLHHPASDRALKEKAAHTLASLFEAGSNQPTHRTNPQTEALSIDEAVDIVLGKYEILP